MMSSAMLKNFKGTKLYQEWGKMVTIVASPGFFIATALTVVTLYLAVSNKNNIAFSNTMAVIGSIFGAAAGAFFKEEYNKISGKSLLEKKGRAALRNLQSISKQLCNTKIWITNFAHKTEAKDGKAILDELGRHISTIELNIVAGLEDWVDIVPEFKEKSRQQAEFDRQYQESVRLLMLELIEKKRALATAKDERAESELKKKIPDIEQQIEHLQRERVERVAANVLPSNANITESLISIRGCPSCGMSFVGSPTGTLGADTYCSECRENQLVAAASAPSSVVS